jgi:hypothetical protein
MGRLNKFLCVFPKGTNIFKNSIDILLEFTMTKPGDQADFQVHQTGLLVDLERDIIDGGFNCMSNIFGQRSYLKHGDNKIIPFFIPFFKVGINPKGPRYLAILVNIGIISGVAMHRLKLSFPAIISETSSEPPTMDAPACLASSTISGGANTRTLASEFIATGKVMMPLIPFELKHKINKYKASALLFFR